MNAEQKQLTGPAIVLRVVDPLGVELRRDGWTPGVAPDAEAAAIDRTVCDESTCDACGHTGAAYLPAMQSDPRPGCAPKYRAFAICRGCGSHREF